MNDEIRKAEGFVAIEIWNVVSNAARNSPPWMKDRVDMAVKERLSDNRRLQNINERISVIVDAPKNEPSAVENSSD